VCKAQRWYESQSRRLNNEDEKFFSALRTDGSALRASMHCLPQCQTQYKIASYSPVQYQQPPFNIPRSAPAMYGNFPTITPHPFFVPKLDGNMLEQDPIVGIVPSKSVMSLTGHPV